MKQRLSAPRPGPILEAMASDILWLEDVPEALWRTYREQGVLTTSRAAPDALARSWQRSRAQRAPLSLAPSQALVRGEALREAREQTEVLQRLGQGLLEHTARAASERDHVLLLTDAQGMVVHSLGGGGFAEDAQRAYLIEGALWSEAARGTNAIGTAAIEGRATAVLGRAHYAADNHDLACYAAPIRDVTGRVVGVLDATSRVGRADRALAALISASALAFEQLLRLGAYAAAGATVVRTIQRSIDDLESPAALVEAPGSVQRVNRKLRELLQGVHLRDLRSTLNLDWLTLSREALHPSSGGLTVSLQTARGGRAFRVSAEPIVAPSGALLSVLVRLTPDESARKAQVKPRAMPQDAFAPIFARDPALLAALDWTKQVAQSDLPVMLLAETGAGKELVAAAIHQASPRKSGPFVPVNCGAIAPSLLESELFGYAPGAFTGADRRGRTGLLHAAAGGTLFLDEVAEMPLAMQAALLRVLDTQSFRRVGEQTLSHTDARIVCATCRDLNALVAAGSFRQDLFYRLRGAIIRLPPLRERTDVVALACHLIEARARALCLPVPPLSVEAEALISAYSWPGNVRELKSALEVALVACRGEPELGVQHLPREMLLDEARAPSRGLLEDHQLKTVRRVLAEARGNISVSAKKLGVARSTLYRMLRRHGLTEE